VIGFGAAISGMLRLASIAIANWAKLAVSLSVAVHEAATPNAERETRCQPSNESADAPAGEGGNHQTRRAGGSDRNCEARAHKALECATWAGGENGVLGTQNSAATIQRTFK
jgi:hypothetical protein